jgi:hypothetical protein
LIIRSECGDGDYEQVIRFNSDGSEFEQVEADLHPTSPSAIIAEKHPVNPNGVYYTTLFGGILITLMTIALVVVRRNLPRIKKWAESRQAYSKESLYEFQMVHGAARLDDQQILQKLGKGANAAYATNL